jgi:hypothetical protein
VSQFVKLPAMPSSTTPSTHGPLADCMLTVADAMCRRSGAQTRTMRSGMLSWGGGPTLRQQQPERRQLHLNGSEELHPQLLLFHQLTPGPQLRHCARPVLRG